MRKIPRELITGIVDAVVVIVGLVVGSLFTEQEKLVVGIVVALQPVAVGLLLFYFGDNVVEKLAARLRE